MNLLFFLTPKQDVLYIYEDFTLRQTLASRILELEHDTLYNKYKDREGEIILKKYSPIGELSQFAGQYAEAMAQTTGHLVCITDRDHVIAASGAGKKEFEGKPISRELDELMEDRGTLVASRDENNFIRVTLDDSGA